MLEIKGELSLLDILQMLRILDGSYVIRTEDGELHIKNGHITWFSKGDAEKCIDYIASYRGRVRVESSGVREEFSLPIEDAVLRASFKYDGYDELERATCPAPESWFALVKEGEIIANESADVRQVEEVLSIWKTMEDALEELHELVVFGKEGVLYAVRHGGVHIVGFCRKSRMVGILRQAVRRLTKHVSEKAEGEVS